MKKLIITILTAIALTNGITYAQEKEWKITGTTMLNGKAAEGISVGLLQESDSSIIKTEVTDKTGSFVFSSMKNGNYLLHFSGITIEPSYNAISVQDADVLATNYNLAQKIKRLDDVVVTARKPYIEMKADKLVVNVDASPGNAGNTAMEVLEKSPGLSVDNDGNIRLKGRQGVQVMIDGKPTHLSGNDLANILRNMPAAEIEQLEIMTNPPARYEAAGNSGIINIKTKKSKTMGWNGSINGTYAQGVYPKAGGGFQLNYRRDKMNIYGLGGYHYREGFQEFEVNRNILDEVGAKSFNFRQHTFMPDIRRFMNGKVGIDYDFSKRTALSASVNIRNVNMTYDAQSRNRIFDKDGNLQIINHGRTFMKPNVTNKSGNINLVHQLDSTGAEISFNADYISYTDDHKQYFSNSFFNHAGVPTGKNDSITGYLPTGFEVYAAKVDFVKPFAKAARLELGAKASYVLSDNDIRFDSIINSRVVPDNKRTNHFIYKENIVAGYVTYHTPLTEKLNMQAGLRYEYTNGRGHSLTKNTKFSNSYGQWFPTLYFSYKGSGSHSFNLNYGRRITRPQYRDLNPFVFIIDQYTSQQGNPYLQPQFSHNIEFSHSFKNTITSTLHYNIAENVISEIVEPKAGSEEVSLIKRNISKQQQFGLAVNIHKPVNNWLTVMSNNIVFHNNYKGQIGEAPVNAKGFGANFFAALQFKFRKGWEAEVNGFYNTQSVEGISLHRAMGMISFAASKSILNNKGKITLNLRDPFLLQRYSGTTRLSNIEATINSKWENRSINLSFNYRFGKNYKTKKQSAGSATEEQSRIGG